MEKSLKIDTNLKVMEKFKKHYKFRRAKKGTKFFNVFQATQQLSIFLFRLLTAQPPVQLTGLLGI